MAITQLDTETADLDLTTPVTVLTHTPSASVDTLCQAHIQLGDGVKDLDGTGGTFQLFLVIGGQSVPIQMLDVAMNVFRACLQTPPFTVPANQSVVIDVMSPNAADTDVTVAARLFEVGASGLGVADAVWDEDVAAAHGTAGTAGLLLRVLGAAISTRANNATLNALLAVPDVASNTIAHTLLDRVLSVANHNVSGSVGRRLRIMHDAFGFSDDETAQAGSTGTTLVLHAAQSAQDGIWAGALVYLTGGTGAGQFRAISQYAGATRTATVDPAWEVTPDNTTTYILSASGARSIVSLLGGGGAGLPAAVADAVWDEDLAAAHGGADTAGLWLRVLSQGIAGRTFNPTLNGILGVVDTGAGDTAIAKTADAVWDEDVAAAHGTAGTAGLLLRVLGAAISTRANNATLSALLAVPDVANNTVAHTLLDQILSGATHNVADSTGRRLRELHDLLKTGGAGDAAEIRAQARKLDLDPLALPGVADSMSATVLALAALVATVNRQILVSVLLSGSTLRLEVAVEVGGVIDSTPTTCAADIFDSTGGLIRAFSAGEFGSLNARGWFGVEWTSHTLEPGRAYQARIVIDGTIITTKAIKVISA